MVDVFIEHKQLRSMTLPDSNAAAEPNGWSVFVRLFSSTDRTALVNTT